VTHTHTLSLSLSLSLSQSLQSPTNGLYAMGHTHRVRHTATGHGPGLVSRLSRDYI
jgi:hypothetical protein